MRKKRKEQENHVKIERTREKRQELENHVVLRKISLSALRKREEETLSQYNF